MTSSNTIPPVVTWSLLTAGAWLIYASVRGLQPLAELRATLTGAPKPGLAPAILDLDAGATLDSGSNMPANSSRQGSLAATPELVSIGQGGHRLAPATAQAFTRWQGAFGRQIPVTDSYRSYADQAAAHARDPKRFASADTSRHVRGQAVDVNLQALGATPENATWKALYASALATGWCNPRGPYKGDHAEPWHFSYPGCG